MSNIIMYIRRVDCRAKTSLWRLMFTVCIAVGLLSCGHKDLDFNDQPLPIGAGTLGMHFDWRLSPDAEPSTMLLHLFPISDRPALVHELLGRDGGVLTAPAGDYQAIAYNGGTETLLLQGNGYESMELYTRQTELADQSPAFGSTRYFPRAAGTDDMAVVQEPDELWVTHVDTLIVGDGSSVDVTLTMHPATTQFNVVIHGVENLPYVSDLSATLSGLSGSMFPATGRCSDTPCIVPFPMIATDSTTIQGKVRSFGHCPGEVQESHQLIVYALLRDGTKWYYTADVTERLHTPVGIGNEVTIDIERLPFPKPITNGSGLHPSVEVWHPVQIDIQM